jgi:hypothetical protein
MPRTRQGGDLRPSGGASSALLILYPLALTCGGGAPELGYRSTGAGAGKSTAIVTADKPDPRPPANGCDYVPPGGARRLRLTLQFPDMRSVSIDLAASADRLEGVAGGYQCTARYVDDPLTRETAVGVSGRCSSGEEEIPFETLRYAAAADVRRLSGTRMGTRGTPASWLVVIVGKRAVAARATPGQPGEALRGRVLGDVIVFDNSPYRATINGDSISVASDAESWVIDAVTDAGVGQDGGARDAGPDLAARSDGAVDAPPTDLAPDAGADVAGDGPADLRAEAVSTASLAIDPPLASFGWQSVAKASSPVTFIVTNNGNGPSGTPVGSIVDGDVAEFPITQNGCIGPLGPGGSCKIEVRMEARTGTIKRASLLVSATPGGSASASFIGSASPVIIAPQVKAFGPVAVGALAERNTFTVTNPAGSPATTTALRATIARSTAFAITGDTCSNVSLASGASCTVEVAFAPTTSGSFAGWLVVNGFAGEGGAASLSGSAVQVLLSVDRPTVDSGLVVIGQSADSTVTFTNRGAMPTGSLVPALSGDVHDWVITSTTCLTALAPGGTCRVTMRFAPTSLGQKAATLTVAGNPGEMASVQLSGTGING